MKVLLPYRGGKGCLSWGGGGKSDDSSADSVTTKIIAFKLVMAFEPHLIFKTGHGSFAIDQDFLFLKHL